jgi:hypothetical protein
MLPGSILAMAIMKRMVHALNAYEKLWLLDLVLSVL